MNIESIRKNSPLLIISLLVMVLLALFISSLTTASSKIVINTIPPGAKGNVGDNIFETPAEVELKLGKHKVSLKKAGFKNLEASVLLNSNEKNEATFRLYSADVSPSSLQEKLTTTQLEESDLQKLLQSLPYQTLHFQIEYQGERAQPSVVVTLLAILNKPSQYANYKKQLKQYQTEALDWIRSKKSDPQKLNIIWKPTDPSNF